MAVTGRAHGGALRWATWRQVLSTTSPPQGVRLDAVGRWLVISRAAVLPMTIVAGLIGGLLAVGRPGASWTLWGLAFVGIVAAHVANNLMNDLFDEAVGLDTADYPRALYAPHPTLAGLISRRGLIAVTAAVNAVDLAIGVYLFTRRGWPVLALAGAGFALSAAYTAPPLRLKRRGLGELDVLVVWGPLMVGGVYFSTTGDLPWEVLLASVPYALLCTAVLMAKHTDKLAWDEAAGVRTLPVILGERSARRWTQGLMIAAYPAAAAAVVLGALPWPALAMFGAVPVLGRSSRIMAAPRPESAPGRWPIWPLWYAAFAFVHTRRAGALLVLGLAVAAVAGIEAYGY